MSDLTLFRFSRYDTHGVRQINRNSDLIRYRRFAPDLLLELVSTEIDLPTLEDVERAKPYLLAAYEGGSHAA